MAFPGKVICKWWIVQVYVTLPNWAHLRHFFSRWSPRTTSFAGYPTAIKHGLLEKTQNAAGFLLDFPSELNLRGSATGISRRDRNVLFEPPTNICVKRAFSTLAIETRWCFLTMWLWLKSHGTLSEHWNSWSFTEPKPSLLAAFQDVFWWNL